MPTSSKFVLLRVEIFFFPTSILPLSPCLALPLLPPSSHFLSFPHLRSFTLSAACFFPSIFSASSPHFLHSPLSPFLLLSFVFLSFPFPSFLFLSFLSPCFSSSAQCVQTGVHYTASSDLFCLGKWVWLTACCSLSASSVHIAHNTEQVAACRHTHNPWNESKRHAGGVLLQHNGLMWFIPVFWM